MMNTTPKTLLIKLVVVLFILTVFSIGIVKGQQNYLIANAPTNSLANGIYEPNGTNDGVTAYQHVTENFSMYRAAGFGWVVCSHSPPFANCLQFIDFVPGSEAATTPPFSGWSTTMSVSIALPVELTFFKGSLIDESVFLEWQTASETNNYGFEIQKSKDGFRWESIDFIQGMGSDTEINYYSYYDKKPLSNTNFYRLQQMDYDGTIDYSDIISIRSKNNAELTFSPNPITDQLTITGFELKENTHLEVFNKTGILVLKTSLSSHHINISVLPKGMYFMKVDNGAEYYWGKIVKI